MWVRAVWLEGGREEEGVVPACWIQGKSVLWPPGANASRAFSKKEVPGSHWRSFTLIKVKVKSDSQDECENYDDTTSVETDDEIGKRAPKRKTFQDFVTEDRSETESSSIPVPHTSVKMPAQPSKFLAADSPRSRGSSRDRSIRASDSFRKFFERKGGPCRSRSPVDRSRTPQSYTSHHSPTLERERSRTPRRANTSHHSPTLERERSGTPRRAYTSHHSPTLERERSRTPRRAYTSHHSPTLERERSGTPRRAYTSHHSPTLERERSGTPRRAYTSHHSPTLERERSRTPRRAYTSHHSPTLERERSRTPRRAYTSHHSPTLERERSRTPRRAYTSHHSPALERDRSRSPLRRTPYSSDFRQSPAPPFRTSTPRSTSSNPEKERPRMPRQMPHMSDALQSPAPEKQTTIPKSRKEKENPGAFPMSTGKFQRRVLYMLTDIRNLLQQSTPSPSASGRAEYAFIRAETLDDFHEMELSSKDVEERRLMVQTLSLVGGANVRDNVKRIMERIMTNQLMSKFNMRGNNNKLSFRTTSIAGVIMAGAMKTNPSATEADISSAMARCLKYAPDRRGGGGRGSEKTDLELM